MIRFFSLFIWYSRTTLLFVGKTYLSTERFLTLVSVNSYFDDAGDEVDPADLMYQPAPGSPSRKEGDAGGNESEDSDDPLDAFMQNIEVWVMCDNNYCNAYITVRYKKAGYI